MTYKSTKYPYRPQRDIIVSKTNDTPETSGLLDFLLARKFTSKRTDVKKWLKYGHVAVNGVITSAFDYEVEPGMQVDVNVSRPFPQLRHPRLKIVYEDDDVIVVNKGYGLLSVGTESRHKEENAFEILKAYVKSVNPANKVFVVHRLDRDTSGLMMFTKTQEAQEAMRHNWNNMVLERLYVALLEGSLENETGYVKSRLTENSRFMVYSTDNPEEGKVAVTHYKVLQRGNGYTLAEFSLDTGRKNQIRVHASEMGHPIAGDRKYGAHTSPLHRLCLHARTLRFAHPITKKDMNFELPVPKRFLDAVRPGARKQNKEV